MEVLQRLLDEIARFFDSPAVRFVIQAVAIYVVLLWGATAYWAYRDLQTRTTNPVAPYLAAALIILFTPLLFPFGVIIYRIVRPSETVAEANERALAEEAMMVEIESQPHCANCGRQVHEDWIICPTCRNRLRRVCPNCSRLIELDWSLCAWCGKDFERAELLHEVAVPPPAGRPLRAPDVAALPTQRTDIPAIPSGNIDSRMSEPAPRTATGDN
ncbi:MAG: zinc ribbon domain-containing protein [Chloroflexota bacterium]|nr:zinc ribbon domain-containing protein [Chloroflexota bacterium]